MSEMIERVARALCLANGEDPDKPSGAFGVWWKSYRDEARAAIEAVRTPTEVMTNEWPHAHAHLIEGHWRRAIDAALSEKP